MASVGRNVFLSSLAYWSIQVVRAGQQFVWVPLFLTAFGKELYGEWLTLVGLAGYMTMADMGVQIYLLNLLTRAHVRGEIEQYRRIFRSGLMLFAFVGGIALIGSIIFSSTHGPSRVLGLKIIGPTTASLVFMILAAGSLLIVLSQILRGVFRSVGENPKFVWFGVAREAITFIVVAGALWMKLGPIGLALVSSSIAVGMIIWVVPAIIKRFSNLVDFGIHHADSKTVLGIVSGGSIRLAGMLAGLLLVQGTLIITNWALGAAMVALVATCRTLANTAIQIGGAVGNATLPEFSRLEAAGDFEEMSILLRRSLTFVLLTSGIICIGLFGLGPWLFEIWTGSRFENTTPLIYLFAASVIVDSIRMPLSLFLLGCNRIAWTSVTDIVYAFTSLGMMWLLFSIIGAWAVPIATITSGLIIYIPSVLIGSARILGYRYLFQLIGRATVAVALLALTAAPLGLSSISGSRLSFLFIHTILGCIAFCVLVWLLVLNRADAKVLKKRLMRVAGRR